MAPSDSTPGAGELSRRAFFLFLFLAPASFACILAIILVLQYKQFRSLLAPAPEVAEMAWISGEDGRLRALENSFRDFAESPSQGAGDSLWLSAGDLNVLLAASPVARSQGLRMRVEIGDSSLIAHSTQRLADIQGRLAWIFKKLGRDGYLNAVLQGPPSLSGNRLELTPERAWMSGQKVPRSALVKRGGTSPEDFIAPGNSLYGDLVRSLSDVKLSGGKVLLLRKH